MPTRKEQIKKFIDGQVANIAERTLGEEFLKLAESEGMTARYKQSLKITTESGNLILELDYRGENDEPLGVWFEHGTKDHFIKPTNKKVLSWIEGGQRFFSKGHFVKGIPERRIMERMRKQGLLPFLKMFKEEFENA